MNLPAALDFTPAGSMDGRLAFRSDRRILFLRPCDIRRVEGVGNYSRIHAHAGFLVRESVSSLATRLAPYGFQRVHRSAVVNLAHVTELRRKSRYRFVVILTGGAEVPLATAYRRDLEHLLCGR